MPAAVIIKLIAEVGFPLAQQLLAIHYSKDPEVPAGTWETLAKLQAYRSGDSLAAAGFKIADGKLVPLAP